MEQIEVGNIVVHVERKNIKNIHLAVYPPDGRVRVAVPENITTETIRLFTISKLGWIKRHQQNFKKQERQTQREYVSGESHYFNGKRYLLNVIFVTGHSKVLVRHNYLDLLVKEKYTQQQKQKVLNQFYRQHLKEVLPPLIAKYEQLIGVHLQEYGIKQMKTKWGTCNIEKRRIWLNLELAKKSIENVEYIVAHEMIHFLERNHNDTFRAYLDKYIPDWRFLKDSLNQSKISA